MELKELTKELCAMSGPSGFESSVCRWVAGYLAPFADKIDTDALGNMIAIHRCGKSKARMLLLDAHMDEIGLIVTGAEEGFLKFSAIGGVDPRMLPAREVRVLGETPFFGVIDTMPPHLLSEEDMGRAIQIDKLCIDVGLTQVEALKAAPAGTPVVYASGCEELGDRQLCGKAMDDRSCVAIILKAFEELSAMDLNVDICCLVSTQEEVGHRGAQVGAWSVAPDYAIVVDVTHAKTPDARDVLTDAGLGAAVGIGPNMSTHMAKKLLHLAADKGIPCQTEVCAGGDSGTNARAVQVSREGVATALISLPLKYMHTPLETACVGDMEAIKKLIVEYVAGAEE